MSGIVGTMLSSVRDGMVGSLKSIETNKELGKYGKPVAQATALVVTAVALGALVGIAASCVQVVTGLASLAALAVVVSPFCEGNEVMEKVKKTALSVLDQLLDRIGLKNVFEGTELNWVGKEDTAKAEGVICAAAAAAVVQNPRA